MLLNWDDELGIDEHGMMLCCIYEVGCNAGDVLQAKACPSINGRAVSVVVKAREASCA